MLTARVTCALRIHVILSVRHIRAVYVEILDLAFSSSLPVQRPVVKRPSPPPLLTFATTLRSDSSELRCT